MTIRLNTAHNWMPQDAPGAYGPCRRKTCRRSEIYQEGRSWSLDAVRHNGRLRLRNKERSLLDLTTLHANSITLAGS